MENKTTRYEILPGAFIDLSSVPKDLEQRKNNIRKFYDACNEAIDNPDCFYTEKEIEQLKKDANLQKRLGIKFI